MAGLAMKTILDVRNVIAKNHMENKGILENLKKEKKRRQDVDFFKKFIKDNLCDENIRGLVICNNAFDAKSSFFQAIIEVGEEKGLIGMEPEAGA